MKLAYIFLIALAFVAGGCVDRNRQAQAKVTEQVISDKTVHVAVAPVTVKTLTDTVDISGSMTTADDTEIGAKQSGKIVSVYVRDGDAVAPGEVIARQDTTQLRAALSQALGQLSSAEANLAQAKANAAYGPSKSAAAVRQAQAGLRSAQATLDKAKAGARPEERAQAEANLAGAKTNLDVAKKDLDRKRALADQGAIARNVADQAESAYATALQQYNNALQAELEVERGNRKEDIDVAAEGVREAREALRTAQASQKLDVTLDDAVRSSIAQVASAQGAVDLARANLNDAEIRAPFAGRISGNPVQAGTVVGPGTAVAREIGGQGAYFEGQVPESVIESARPGATLDVTIDALSGRKFIGRIAAVNPLGANVGRLFLVRIMLEGDMAGVKANMYAHGKLKTNSVPDARVVPADAVLGSGSTKFVFIVEGGKAKKVNIRTGLQVGQDVQVMGVGEGVQVVVQGQNNLNDGDPVKIDATSSNGAAPQGT